MKAATTTNRGVRRAASVVMAAAFAVSIAACSSDSGELTLADTKSPVQLLRNEAGSRVPSGLVGEVANAEDTSSNCRSEEVDPKGLQRSWKSSVRIVLTPEADLDLVLSKFYVSFKEDGWEQGTYGSASIVEFTRDDSLANIHVTVRQAKEDKPAELQVQVAGPCVMTGGADSDEVKRLEASAPL